MEEKEDPSIRDLTTKSPTLYAFQQNGRAVCIFSLSPIFIISFYLTFQTLYLPLTLSIPEFIYLKIGINNF